MAPVTFVPVGKDFDVAIRAFPVFGVGAVAVVAGVCPRVFARVFARVFLFLLVLLFALCRLPATVVHPTAAGSVAVGGVAAGSVAAAVADDRLWCVRSCLATAILFLFATAMRKVRFVVPTT